MLNITSKNFDKEVAKSDIPVLADFWAGWCGPCQMMGPVFEELGEEFKGKIKFVKINADEEQELCENFGISGIPCLVYMSKGKEINRIVGFAPKEQLKKKIEALK